MNEKIVGILGGMGPEATVDLMARVIKATPANDDIDHIRLVVDNNPKVPSRIKALIEKSGESPLPCLQKMALKLAGWGVDFLAMPCNTAHFYHKEIQRVVNIPVLNMIDLCCEAIIAQNPGLKTVGILASTAVLNLGLYEKRFAENGVELLRPSDDLQEGVMAAIRKIKTGRYGEEVMNALQAAVDYLTEKGVEVLLLACTELSIIGDKIDIPVQRYDSSQVLAEAIVKNAKGDLASLEAVT
jgi:aspartate racemase